MSDVETRVYYSLQYGPGGFRDQVLPSAIHSAQEKAMAAKAAQQTVVLTWGDLQITLFVCDDIPDTDIHQWMNYLKRAAVGLEPGFARSRYVEDAESNPIRADNME